MAEPIKPKRVGISGAAAVAAMAARRSEEMAANSERMVELLRNSPENRTARAAQETAQETRRAADAMQAILDGQVEAEARENRMLKWTVIAAICAVIAALLGVASLAVAIIAL